VIYPKTEKGHPFVNGDCFILCRFPANIGAKYPIDPLLVPLKGEDLVENTANNLESKGGFSEVPW
jgi:hypothetical protein